MSPGKLTITIDLELAWGVWDIVSAADLKLAEEMERPICTALLQLLDRHQVPATWATVAALLDQRAAASLPGAVACWYAPDVIEQILSANVRHEIGSQGGRHVYFNALPASAAATDIDYAHSIHQTNGLPFRSWVFPRNAVGHLDALASAGIGSYRGPDVGWVNAARAISAQAGRIANLLDKSLPIPPQAVVAENRAGLVNVPGSMHVLSRNGLRRLVLPQVTRIKLRLGLERARNGATFHLWFHPSNFYYRRQEQLDTLDWFLALAAEAAGRGTIEIVTLGAYAARPPVVQLMSARSTASLTDTH